jgi:peptide/nickel transport system permease protein
MLVFVARRLVGMILVLVAVSFIVFLIFVVVPGGDPAVRIAGRTANDQNIRNIRHDWGFDRPLYVQYYDLMKKAFTNKLV